MGVSYKNTSTGDVVTFPEENLRLERLDRWERVGGSAAKVKPPVEPKPEQPAPPADPDTPTEDEPEQEQELDLSDAPPKNGKGSGRDAWAEWAEGKGYEIDDDMSREDIWEALGV